MKISIDRFGGEIPRLNRRLLPDGFAQTARGVRLEDGTITPLRQPALVHSFPSPVQTIYKHGSEWFGFPGVVNIAPGPVASDRLYFTGDEFPKMRAGGLNYRMGLTPPAAAPTLTALTAPDPALTETVLYTYTFVTIFDEESAPAPVSAPLNWSPGVVVRLTGFSGTISTRVNRIRIYRSQTSFTGVTDLYFVAEVPIATTTYDHDLAAQPLQEVLPSTNFDPPPDTMKGLTAMPNGMMAAFSGKEVLFCEPYIPHAWPRKYAMTVDHDVVGLCAFGSTLAVLTTGTPYVMQGSHPDSMVSEKLESGQPCISAAGIVDLGFAAAYPSHDGLVLISPSSTSLASRNLFARKDWQSLSPSGFFAANYDGRYVFSYEADTILTVSAGAPDTNYTGLDIYDGGLPAGTSGMAIYNGGTPLRNPQVSALGIIDLTGEQPFFVRTTTSETILPTGLHYSATDGKLYILSDDMHVYEFDADSRGPVSMVWRSKLFDLPSLQNFGVLMVESEDDPGPTFGLTTRVLADGQEVYSTQVFNDPVRLPSGFMSRQWEIEIEGTASVRSIRMAVNFQDLMR